MRGKGVVRFGDDRSRAGGVDGSPARRHAQERDRRRRRRMRRAGLEKEGEREERREAGDHRPCQIEVNTEERFFRIVRL